MRVIVMFFILGFFPAAVAQEKPEPPTGPPPEIMVARAIQKDGGIVVSFSSPVLKPRPQRVEAEVDGKTVSMTRITYDFVKWHVVDLMVDGKTVKAFGVDGKQVAAKVLPERLKTTARVAVMLTAAGTEAKLDPYYLRALREETVVFTIPLTTFYGAELSKQR